MSDNAVCVCVCVSAEKTQEEEEDKSPKKRLKRRSRHTPKNKLNALQVEIDYTSTFCRGTCE